MTNVLLTILITTIISCSVYYLYRERKKGNKCIGCPYAKQCADKSCSKSDFSDNYF